MALAPDVLLAAAPEEVDDECVEVGVLDVGTEEKGFGGCVDVWTMVTG